MDKARDGMMLVRADLCDRLDRLRESADRMTIRDLASGIQAIHVQALAYGLAPLADLAAAFERAIRSEPRHCPAGLYFDRLRDAVGCEPSDRGASISLLASISVRLAA